MAAFGRLRLTSILFPNAALISLDPWQAQDRHTRDDNNPDVVIVTLRLSR